MAKDNENEYTDIYSNSNYNEKKSQEPEESDAGVTAEEKAPSGRQPVNSAGADKPEKTEAGKDVHMMGVEGELDFTKKRRRRHHSGEGHGKKHRKHRKKMSTKKKILVIILVIVGILLILAAVAVGIIFHYIHMLDIVPEYYEDEVVSNIEKDEDYDPELSNSSEEDIKNIEDKIRKNLEDKSIDIMKDKDILNILLIGTDGRTVNERGRSDSMILMSVNKKSGRITMTSFLRDSYVNVPGFGNTRLNHAYAYGGPSLLMDTIEQNFKIEIDKYIRVNFYSFVSVIDTIGGVDINITDDEIQYFNRYLYGINQREGRDPEKGKLEKGGKYKLDGCQALAYSRIRYVGTDFQRTERQRTVLEQVFQHLQGLNLVQLNDMLNKLLPEIKTNLQEGEIFSLVLQAPSILKYERKQCRVPCDGSWTDIVVDGMMVLGIDFQMNQSYLKKNIYNG